MSTTEVIRASNLGKTYGSGASKFVALDNVSLSIKAGESVAIVGKSGSGKSTLMHLLALLDTPELGSVAVNGIETKDLKPRQIERLRNKEFGFVFQQFFLNPQETVLENAVLPLKIAGVSASERKRRGEQVLEQFGLLEKAKNKATALSGGQKQRVVISRALVNSPSIIFADEPTGNLDSATGQVVVESLFELNKSQGITLVIVTHDPDLAARCERQIQMKDGVIVNQTNSKAGAN
jgi:putative ABC transport system ATP-binding protein